MKTEKKIIKYMNKNCYPLNDTATIVAQYNTCNRVFQSITEMKDGTSCIYIKHKRASVTP